jgi:hypothetical protein
MDAFHDAQQQFEADLDRLNHLLSVISLLRDFGGSEAPQAITDRTVAWHEATSLLNGARERRTDMPILSGSLLLYLCGRFEYFFKTQVELTAEAIAENCAAFNQLPRKLQESLIKLTAKAAQNSNKYGYDAIQVRGFINILSENFLADAGLNQINSNCIALTESNMRPSLIQDLLTRVNVKKFWSELGKQHRMKQCLETREDNATAEAAKSLLNEIMDERNAVAHPTASTVFPDVSKVLRYVQFLRVVGSEGVGVIQVTVNAFQPTEEAIGERRGG